MAEMIAKYLISKLVFYNKDINFTSQMPWRAIGVEKIK